jgi:dTDP-4-amino-4,6-dideoxygalactose transaminase
MIPLHRPSFGFSTVIASMLAGGERASVSGLEAAYAAFAGMPAVWLPSARAGISWALRVATNAETTILAPAFTCGVVHDVLAQAGGKIQWFEPDTDELLVSPASFAPHQTGRHALLLCEVYGHTYDLAQLSRPSTATPALRIVDMAMAVPHAALFARLALDDFAVISFGAGKNMYAGWGAMGFTRNPALAREVSKIRDAALSSATFRLAARRALEAGARTIGNQPMIHALARKLRDMLRRKSSARAPGARSEAILPAEFQRAPEWTLPSTRVDRRLALWNLEQAPAAHAARVKLAGRYQKDLAGATGIRCPKPGADALSHFTVRLDARIRDAVKARLYAAGINTVTLWAFSARLNPKEFPRAFGVSSEVLNLPLSPWMTENQVDFVCENLIRNVGQAAGIPPQA